MWDTRRLADQVDYISPGGVTEIRLLPSFEGGELVCARTARGKVAAAGTQIGVGELFYVLEGDGELWRKTAVVEDVTALIPGRCVSIPPGISYQFRAISDLDMLVATFPRWRRDDWRDVGPGYWDLEGQVLSTAKLRPGPWSTTDIGERYDYLAPDGSEIRLLPTYDNGGLAACRLPAGRISSAVRHRTVQEIWYVVDGSGQMWRADGEAEEVVDLDPATCVTIPTGVSFQFRASESVSLDIVIATFPRWAGPDEAEPVGGHWRDPVVEDHQR